MSIKDSHMTELEGESLNITEHNIEQLKQLFPNVFTEGKIDFDALKSELGEHIETNDERYQFTWAGKEQAKRIATTPTLGTLRPAPEESVDWDNTENLYIEGDNLEVLKLLQKSYFNKVKMIYIDPPYNTGKDFVYKDDYKDNLANYQRLTGQLDEEGNPLSTNRDNAGRYHSNWLNMMYPRLKLARNLLRDDGVIFIHIDENEYKNLEHLMCEIFGDENNLGTVIWDKRNPKGDSTKVAQQHEYLVVFSKNYSNFKETSTIHRVKENAEQMIAVVEKLISKYGRVCDEVRDEYKQWIKDNEDKLSGGEKAYSLIDDSGEIYRPVSMAWPNKKKAPDDYFIPLIHPVTGKACPVPDRGWRNPPTTMQTLLEDKRILFGIDESTQPTRKYLLKENLYENLPSLLYFGGSDDALHKQLGIDNYFENPKPIKVSEKLISSVCKDNDIILDFFAGSSTAAHAVMQLNAEDGGNRKFIMVQIPEPTPENSEARKAGYDTIAEIGKERIRRAAAKIREEHPDTEADLGFKVLKLDTSNIKRWQPTVDTLAADLFDAVDNIEEERTPADLLYEVLLKYGLPLTLPVEEIKLGEHSAFNVAMGSLVACFDENITLETVQAIIDLATADTPVLRVVFRDNGFQDDIVKTNAIQRLKQAGIEDILSI